MNKPTRLILGLCLAGCAAFLVAERRTGQRTRPGVKPSAAGHLVAANSASQPLPATATVRFLPSEIPAAPAGVAPAAANGQTPTRTARPPEESMLSSWAARDPEGAGRWLNQNRNHPKFADMVRGYAIQIAIIDPAAARQWAAVLDGNGNRFGLGGTLEQHIDAIEAMLKGPAEPQTAFFPQPLAALFLPDYTPAFPPQPLAAVFLPDYTPALVRQHPDEEPVLEMRPVFPLV